MAAVSQMQPFQHMVVQTDHTKRGKRIGFRTIMALRIGRGHHAAGAWHHAIGRLARRAQTFPCALRYRIAGVQGDVTGEAELNTALRIPAMHGRARVRAQLGMFGGACVGMQLGQSGLRVETAQNQRAQAGPALSRDRGQREVAPRTAGACRTLGEEADGLHQNVGEIFGDGCVPCAGADYMRLMLRCGKPSLIP